MDEENVTTQNGILFRLNKKGNTNNVSRLGDIILSEMS
jgi:hypothetical protein